MVDEASVERLLRLSQARAELGGLCLSARRAPVLWIGAGDSEFHRSQVSKSRSGPPVYLAFIGSADRMRISWVPIFRVVQSKTPASRKITVSGRSISRWAGMLELCAAA